MVRINIILNRKRLSISGGFMNTISIFISSLRKTLFTILIFFLLLSSSYAKDITLEWDANTESNLAGYKVYYKVGSSGNGVLSEYDGNTLISSDGSQTTMPSGFEIPADSSSGKVVNQLSGIDATKAYYFVITAYDTEGQESLPSNEAFLNPKSDIDKLIFTHKHQAAATDDVKARIEQYMVPAP